MRELGLTIDQISDWFTHERRTPYILVRVSEEHAQSWSETLGVPIRRCYISDELLTNRLAELGVPPSDIIQSVLPDNWMFRSGDFGEVIVYLYHSKDNHPLELIGPKKWRLKESKNSPSHFSDVVQFSLPNWPDACADDTIYCSEVKLKASENTRNRIGAAIAGCINDRTSRLTDTLIWLRERAMTTDLGQIQIAHLNRFLNATQFPPAIKQYFAIVVISSELLPTELPNTPDQQPTDFTLIILSIPNLRNVCNAVYDAALLSGDELMGEGIE